MATSKNSKPADKPGNSRIADNKKALFNYAIEERFEAGVVLQGWEVKALREGKVQLTDGYVLIRDGELFLIGCRINALRAAGDARYPVAVGAVSMAVVLAGGSWFFGVQLGWGLPGIWLAYVLDEWLRGLLMWRRWLTQGWVPHARATHARMRRQQTIPPV